MKTKAGSFSKLLLILAPVFGAFVSSPVAASSATCISHLIYEQAVSQERLPVVGALPEELIAKFDRLAGTGELLALLADDLKVRKIRYGRVTKIVGGTLRVRTLVLQRGANGQALLALMRAMLEEKQRQLRFEMRPHVFIRKMDEFAARLEAIAYPALGALDPALLDATRERVGWTRFTLRAILGASTSPGRLWPLSQEDAIDHLTGEPRAAGIRGPMAVQWSMTRLLYAARAAILALSVIHLPAGAQSAYELYQMRDEFAAVARNLSEKPWDDRAAFESNIRIYEQMIADGEKSLRTETDPDIRAETEENIGYWREVVQSNKDEIEALD